MSYDPCAEFNKNDSKGKKKGGKKKDDGDDEDETLCERLEGLLEMFPVPFINCICAIKDVTVIGVIYAYSTARTFAWIMFSTSIILFAPVIFEVERAQVEELQRNQQKELLLGPNSAISAGIPPPIMPKKK